MVQQNLDHFKLITQGVLRQHVCYKMEAGYGDLVSAKYNRLIFSLKKDYQALVDLAILHGVEGK
jgi:hypothetical protein